MAKIESKDSHLRGILKDELYYQIPIYQHPYQWTEENCEKLLDDLFFNYEDDRDSDYFCGSLVLILISEDSKAKTYDYCRWPATLKHFHSARKSFSHPL
ncbi:hypothetical protein VN0773_02990 [Helicobacter pylori]